MGLRCLQAQTRVLIWKRSNKCGRGDTGCLRVGDSKYHNPYPLCRLIGPKNEVEVVVNNEQVTTLVDSGAQISAVSMAFAKCHNLPIWQLQQLLDFEGFRGIDIPYIGYTQIQLQIPGVKDYDKDILVFIQKDSHYLKHVPVILGTLHIKDVIQSATREELVKLGDAWEVGTLGSFVLARIDPVRQHLYDTSSQSLHQINQKSDFSTNAGTQNCWCC